MDVLDKNKEFNENFFSGIRTVLNNAFVNKKVHHKANAEVILQAVKDKSIDIEKFIFTIKNLSEDEWSSKYFVEIMKKLDEFIGVSDEFIKKNSYQEIKKKSDLQEIKWELSKRGFVDYAKFSKEFYDSLKYSKNYKLGKEKELLMYTMMEALSMINNSSKQMVEKYYHKNYNANSLRKVLNVKMAVDHLLLRIYFILFNIDETDKIKKYRKVLSSEITEYTVHQIK
jgi:hypothetical protein